MHRKDDEDKRTGENVVKKNVAEIVELKVGETFESELIEFINKLNWDDN